MAVPVESLFSEIRRQCKNCPDPTMADALIRAAQELAKMSWAVKQQIGFMALQGKSQYDLPVDDQVEIIALKAVMVTQPGGSTWPLSPLRSGMFNVNRNPSLPRAYSFVQPNSITIYPTPNANYPIVATVVVQPVDGADTLPEVYSKFYRRDIGHGALAWIFDMPGEVFSDPRAAEREAAAFQSAINNCKTEALRQDLPGNARALPRPFLL